MTFHPGDPIQWTYDHFLGTGYTRITKIGVFKRQYNAGWNGMRATVRFNGNKTDSRVPLSDLRAHVEEQHNNPA